MQIVSYRGPSAPGGVSTALECAWNDPRNGATGWWHLQGATLRFMESAAKGAFVYNLPRAAIEAHYRFCNEYLWPAFHGMFEIARYDSADHQQYLQVLSRIAQRINHRQQSYAVPYFIHDYQLAPIAAEFSRAPSLFWHIPWPAETDDVFQPIARSLAERMSKAAKLGFHAQAYAENFLKSVDSSHRKSVERKLVVAPLGIDFEYWTSMAEAEFALCPITEKYILSVDRGDYTKGVLRRLNGIDAFFERNSEWLGKVRFVNILTRTRPTLPAFDEYWNRCVERINQVNARWGNQDWQPVVHIATPLSPADLSRYYTNASVLLITSRADGLNLTAKEFVACQGHGRGALIVSKYAGVWHELDPHALAIDPNEPGQIAMRLAEALSMDAQERLSRMQSMRRLVQSNCLIRWFNSFSPYEQPSPSALMDSTARN